jgi:hypothetical protein
MPVTMILPGSWRPGRRHHAACDARRLEWTLSRSVDIADMNEHDPITQMADPAM